MKKDNNESRSRSLNLTDNEKRDIVKYLEAGKPLPDKYRFLLFKDDREVELLWNGKTNEVTNVVLPFQTIEQVDEPREGGEFGNSGTLFDTSGRQITGWTNKLIWGDNKLILSSLKNGPLRREIEDQGGIKLIYIDPPFSAGLDYSIGVSIGDGETIQKSPTIIEEFAYRNTWGKGGNTFLSMLYERVRLMRDLLAEDGLLFFRIDWHWGHYTKVMLDEVFGKDNFQSEIVVNRVKKNVTNQGRVTLPTATDSLFVYSNSPESQFVHIETELETQKDGYWRAMDSAGLRINPQRTVEGQTFSPPAGRHFTFNQTRVDELYKEGKVRIRNGKLQYWVNAKDKRILDTNWTDVAGYAFKTGYPTENAEPLLERVIDIATVEGDLVADFFNGSGTTISVAERMGRKWIGTDIGKFSIHTTRKRMIDVQRELKKAGKDFRAFEILNVGKYERESFLNTNEDLRAEEKTKQAIQKEQEFVKLILSAYKAEPMESFNTIVGKKRDRLVAVGPINLPVSSQFVQEIVTECEQKGLTKVDVLGFDYEMGLDFSEYVERGIDISFKIIPREVFDKRAIERGQVNFYDVAYIEAKPVISGRGNIKTLAIELTDFSVFYNQDSGSTDEELKAGRSKIIVENGQVLKVTKDKDTEQVSRELLTKKWSDWIDYWAVDYNFADRKEIIRVLENDKEKEVWTGDYIFDNEWQSFRTKKNRNLELVSAPVDLPKGDYKVAVKVVDIFGNDTTRVIDVKL